MQTVVSPQPSNPFASYRFRQPLAILASLFVAAFIAGGTAVQWMTPPQPVFAACHAANGSCGLDPTKTAVVDAAYFIQGLSSVTPVEPGSATSWTIDAYWGPPSGGANCNDEFQQATVDVAWNGSNWVASNFVGTNDILGLGVCNLVSCGSHASAYRMYADISDPSTNGNNLRQVVFTAVTVPNGTDFNSGTCALGSNRTPTASSFNATDSGSFECSFSCTATGATLNLTYN